MAVGKTKNASTAKPGKKGTKKKMWVHFGAWTVNDFQFY